MISQEQIGKQYIPISIWRPILILSIVIGHSFAIYNGAWQYDFESGVDYIAAYNWENSFFISFQLEAFFFISGYLFWRGRYIERKLTPSTYYHFIKKKFARLYVPSIVFSLLYLYFFTEPIESKDVMEALLLGKGHLWFLPTIFWCFAIHRLLSKWGREHLRIYLLLSFLAIYVGTGIYHFFPTIFTYWLARVTLYYFFFVLGASIRDTQVDNHIRKVYAKRRGKYYILLFAFFFLGLWLIPILGNSFSLWSESVENLINFAVSPLYALAGILAMYMAWLFMERHNYPSRVVRIWVYLSSISFGVYVVHQFILVEVVNKYLLQLQFLTAPWAIPFILIVLGTLGYVALVVAFKKVL